MQGLVPKAVAGEISIVATRQASEWGLQSSENVVLYDGIEARAAYLTLNSRGGQLIARAVGIQREGLKEGDV